MVVCWPEPPGPAREADLRPPDGGLGSDHPARLLLVFFTCYSFAAFGDGLVGVPRADVAHSLIRQSTRGAKDGHRRCMNLDEGSSPLKEMGAWYLHTWTDDA